MTSINYACVKVKSCTNFFSVNNNKKGKGNDDITDNNDSNNNNECVSVTSSGKLDTQNVKEILSTKYGARFVHILQLTDHPR